MADYQKLPPQGGAPAYTQPPAGAPPPQQYTAPPQASYAPNQQYVTVPQPQPGYQAAGPGMPQVNAPPRGGMGIEIFRNLNGLHVKQMVELLEAFTGFETNNKYRLTLGPQQIGFAAEETGCLERQCCGSMRGFKMHVVDNANQPIMFLSRPIRFKSVYACFGLPFNFFCLQDLTVTAPDGSLIGNVVQKWHLCKPKLHLVDKTGQVFANVRGPLCQCPCLGTIKFEVFDGAEQEREIGVIGKEWGGFVKEAFTDADDFGVCFPVEWNPEWKAIAVAAVFLIDFMYFENNDNKNQSQFQG